MPAIGKFHCDEVFACYMLRQLPEFREHDVVRTRDPVRLEPCDVVVDVGGVFDHARKRYDHHQKGFTETMLSLGVLDFSTKLSSAGLVYAHYGKRVIAQVLGLAEDDPRISIFFRKLYMTFVEQIDAVDNGIPQYDGTPRYQTSGGISGRVGRFNPHWNEPDVDPDERFHKAMDCIGEEFVENCCYLRDVWWPARHIVDEAVKRRKEIDPSGKIIVLENGGVPWKEHFFELEEEQGLLNERITYICFGDSTAHSWRVQAIPTNRLAQFENRQSLPKAWRGLRDADLSSVVGLAGCVFVHIGGFIGGHATRDGAIHMAREALRLGAGDEVQDDEPPEKRTCTTAAAANGNSAQVSV